MEPAFVLASVKDICYIIIYGSALICLLRSAPIHTCPDNT
jgi:hypothetical protein